ncbi:MAG: P-loop NTPase [Bacteroidota bacterium]
MHNNSNIVDQASALRELALNQKKTLAEVSAYTWAVTSGKGGVGKSVFALNFALNLAENGHTVLLVDADENLGKLDVMLGLSPKHRIPDVLSGAVPVSAAVLNPYPNFYLLAGSSGSMNYPDITTHERNGFIEMISCSMPEVTDIIFDTGAGIQSKVISYAAAADELIVVSHHEPVAILDAYAVIKMINQKNGYLPMNVVMNKSANISECDEAAAKLQKALKHFLSADIRYLGVVPMDENVGRSIVQQHPLAKQFPKSSAALCIRAIARVLQQRSSAVREKKEMVYA